MLSYKHILSQIHFLSNHHLPYFSFKYRSFKSFKSFALNPVSLYYPIALLRPKQTYYPKYIPIIIHKPFFYKYPKTSYYPKTILYLKYTYYVIVFYHSFSYKYAKIF